MALTLALGVSKIIDYRILAGLASSRWLAVLREESAATGEKNRTVSIKMGLRVLYQIRLKLK